MKSKKKEKGGYFLSVAEWNSATKQQQAICVSCGKEAGCWALATLVLMLLSQGDEGNHTD